MKYLGYIHRLDAITLTWCLERPSAARLARVARTISVTGDGHIYCAVPLLLWLLDYPRGADLVAATVVAFALERPVYFVMKNGFKRRRPPDVLAGFEGFITPADCFSFPSGHASAAFLFATLYSSLISAAMLPVVYAWALLIGLSRVFLGVHFPTDIVVGATLGTTAALFAISLMP